MAIPNWRLASPQVLPGGRGHGFEAVGAGGDRRHAGARAQEAVQLPGLAGGEGAEQDQAAARCGLMQVHGRSRVDQ